MTKAIFTIFLGCASLLMFGYAAYDLYKFNHTHELYYGIDALICGMVARWLSPSEPTSK